MDGSDVASALLPRATARRPRVLVVDDDRAIRLLCVTYLSSAGYDVIEAVDGQDGLERALAERPDVVLLDVSMPVLDGFGLAAALRRDTRTRRLPFVFLSGETDPEVKARAYEAGAHGYFSKPFDISVIAEYVQSVLAHLFTERSAARGGHAF